MWQVWGWKLPWVSVFHAHEVDERFAGLDPDQLSGHFLRAGFARPLSVIGRGSPSAARQFVLSIGLGVGVRGKLCGSGFSRRQLVRSLSAVTVAEWSSVWEEIWRLSGSIRSGCEAGSEAWRSDVSAAVWGCEPTLR